MESQSNSDMPSSARNFDDLPTSARIGLDVLKVLYGKSRPTIYRWINLGLIPKLVKARGTQNAWVVGKSALRLTAIRVEVGAMPRLIIPQKSAIDQRAETSEAWRRSEHLADSMHLLTVEQKQAGIKALLSGVHSWLALSEAARLWESTAAKLNGGV